MKVIRKLCKQEENYLMKEQYKIRRLNKLKRKISIG